ncbi:replicative DNA helicase [Candidatus Contubernalis alkaliaceticus]|uniref:replicative DNA helicase n=1 Tax=Candidatus Contubernalis alkaliaceticus TaxID=338645 RepID=UPI001F4BFD85|nr:DnaB-like helicase C-terminal domain-containing protein [Candidatus Contubernalis alkalaceticus]UNC91670.1 AAA family ATPase [Candidatus Contubernalis alkalaceticus]
MALSEKSLIGSVITEPNCIDLIRQYVPDGSYFKNILLGKVFDMAVTLQADGRQVDISTINDALNLKSEALKQIMNAVNETPTSAHAEDYAKMVRDYYARRLLSELRAVDPLDIKKYPNPLDVVTAIEQGTEKALGIINSSQETSVKDIVLVAYDEYCKEHEQGKNPNMISTGFYDLDELIDGLERGENIIIAARPSMGKTAFGLCICRNVAKRGKKVIIFSLEMRKERLINRIVCTEGSINATRFKRRKLEKEEFNRLITVMGNVGQMPLVIRDDVRTTTEIRSIIAREAAKGDVGLVMIDFLTLLSDPQPRGSSVHNHIGNIAKNIQQIGHAYNVPIITLAQLNRKVEDRNNKRPALSDLRESGNIEEAADKVLFIYREDYYEKDKSNHTGIAEIGAAKTRDGATGACKLLWTPEYTRFDNYCEE